MIKRFLVITVVAFVGFLANGQAAQAFAVPECPCDTAMTINGLTGNEILDMACPGGELAEGADFIFNQEEVAVSTTNPEKSYSVRSIDTFGRLLRTCTISDGEIGSIVRLMESELDVCRQRVISACSLTQLRPIPTLSEWGMIATAGVLGLAGLYAVRRRRAIT